MSLPESLKELPGGNPPPTRRLRLCTAHTGIRCKALRIRVVLQAASFHQLRLKVNQSDGRRLDHRLNASRRTQLDSGIVEMKIDGTLR